MKISKFYFFIKVASILRVSGLKGWIYKSYAKSYLSKGLEALKDVCIQFLFPVFDQVQVEEETASQQSSTNSTDNFAFTRNFFAQSQSDDIYSNKESLNFRRNKEIDEEVLFFSDLLSKEDTIKKTKSTTEFWLNYRKDLPYLFKLKNILLYIPVSSSFIERFFSISGIVCDIRRASMNNELIVMRSMMKANMPILQD